MSIADEGLKGSAMQLILNNYGQSISSNGRGYVLAYFDAEVGR